VADRGETINERIQAGQNYVRAKLANSILKEIKYINTAHTIPFEADSLFKK
jgi:hypothetical protein